MQFATFNAVCDVELGDKVKTILNTITEITDIRTVHYLKDSRVEFEFELACEPGLWFKRNIFVYPAVEQSDREGVTEMSAGQLSTPEVAEAHLDGTLCDLCGGCIGEPVGHARLCSGCEN
ncbi:hypothetical protein [Desulfosporosinus shakirovi]|uniref:hypothetical protein n=1 Tax=Desulfosporosinus shakirovi TaxID=2885154 RepID=UPI001E5ED120|nr:hypothetical protein [Desulfosporosinus sp. SRJS8]MCB8818672.1 hypothetical protein [Desulfosporosinus sp. SRJS8]